MSRKVRIAAADLACQAASALTGEVAAKEVLSLCIMFETWILNGGDAVQERMKILPEDTATVLKLVKD